MYAGNPNWHVRYGIHFHFINWWQLSLGIHIDPKARHMQLHVPGGFITIGRRIGDTDDSTWGPFGYSSSSRTYRKLAARGIILEAVD